MTHGGTRRERLVTIVSWARLPLAVIVLALVTALWFLPREARIATDQGPALRVSQTLRAIVMGLSEYSKQNQGQLPRPEDLITVLKNTGFTSPELFTLREAKGDEPSIYYLPAWKGESQNPAPIVFTNPALFPHGYVYVCFSDEHTELLTGDQNKDFLARYWSRAVPLK